MIEINLIHDLDDINYTKYTAIYWLKSQKAIFMTSNNEFLLKDGMCATMFVLQFG